MWLEAPDASSLAEELRSMGYQAVAHSFEGRSWVGIRMGAGTFPIQRGKRGLEVTIFEGMPLPLVADLESAVKCAEEICLADKRYLSGANPMKELQVFNLGTGESLRLVYRGQALVEILEG